MKFRVNIVYLWLVNQWYTKNNSLRYPPTNVKLYIIGGLPSGSLGSSTSCWIMAHMRKTKNMKKTQSLKKCRLMNFHENMFYFTHKSPRAVWPSKIGTLQGTKRSHLWGKGKSSISKVPAGKGYMLVPGRVHLGSQCHGGDRFRGFSGFQCLMIVRWTMLRLQGVQSSKNPPSLIPYTFSEVHATVSFWHVGLKCLFKKKSSKNGLSFHNHGSVKNGCICNK